MDNFFDRSHFVLNLPLRNKKSEKITPGIPGVNEFSSPFFLSGVPDEICILEMGLLTKALDNIFPIIDKKKRMGSFPFKALFVQPHASLMVHVKKFDEPVMSHNDSYATFKLSQRGRPMTRVVRSFVVFIHCRRNLHRKK